MERLKIALGNQSSLRTAFQSRNTSIFLGISAQNPSSESSSSSRIVWASRPSPSLRFPTSFSNHSAYFFSINGSALNLASLLGDELCQASSSFFCSRAARTEAADRPVSSKVGVKLKRDIRTVEDRWRIEPVTRPMTAATPR